MTRLFCYYAPEGITKACDCGNSNRCPDRPEEPSVPVENPTKVFSESQVYSLWRFQQADHVHNLTCPDHADHPSTRNGNYLIPTIYGLICQYCDYRQNWAPDFCFEYAKFMEETKDFKIAEYWKMI